jgi:hypothetical protein
LLNNYTSTGHSDNREKGVEENLSMNNPGKVRHFADYKTPVLESNCGAGEVAQVVERLPSKMRP